MKHKRPFLTFPFLAVAGVLISSFVAERAQAVIVTIEVMGTIGDVTGSYVGSLVTGQAVSATFVYDTDEAQAGPGSQTTPSTEPGHEFSSFYEFSSPPYGGTVNIPAIPATFNSDTAGLVVNDSMTISGADVNDYVVDGTYDWIEVLGSTTIDGPMGNPADGEEWTLALFSADTNWITDGSLIPDTLPESYTPVMLGIEFDANENEIGVAFVDVSSVLVSGIPEPSRALLLLLGTGSALLVRRRSRPER